MIKASIHPLAVCLFPVTGHKMTFTCFFYESEKKKEQEMTVFLFRPTY